MSNTQQGPFIVTGASGQLGRLVLQQLMDAKVGPIIATSRSTDKLADAAAQGVDVRQADFKDVGSLGAAFAGAKRLLIISTDSLAPGKRLALHTNAINAAIEAGIEHIVFTSFVGPVAESPISFATDNRDTEVALAASGISHTILRNNMYTDMIMMAAPASIGMGQHFAATADGKTGYITRADCALAAAAALMNETATRTLEVTGPAALSQAEVATILSEISGQEIPYIPISTEALTGALVGKGFPESVAEVFASFDTAIADGLMDTTTNAMFELTGKKPTSVREFLIANKAALLAPQS